MEKNLNPNSTPKYAGPNDKERDQPNRPVRASLACSSASVTSLRQAADQPQEAMSHQLRIARPVRDLSITTAMYCRGLGLRLVASFEDHDGFDGVMLGLKDSSYHVELTRCRTHPVAPAPTPEDLLVFYVPTAAEWQAACASMLAAGFKQVASFNPYWETRGRTYEDPDGNRIVLQQAEWRNVEKP